MFSKFTKVLFLTCVSAFFSLAAHANIHTYDKMVVFGDSLSDNGNLFKWAGLPDKPYFEGRFSNGVLWIEILANALHLDTAQPSQFADYAFGGAWAADAENGIGGVVALSFERSLYYTDTPAHSTDISHNLFVMWIGNNDYLQDGRLKENADIVTDKTIHAIKTHIDSLIENGAKHFLILNLPDLGLTPKGLRAIEQKHPEFADRISMLSKLHNKKLAQLLVDEKTLHADIDFIPFDLAGYFDDLIVNPEKYHIKDVVHPCYAKGIGDYEPPFTPSLLMHAEGVQQPPNDYCINTNDYLFWDYVHPTTMAHKLIAEYVANLLRNDATISRV